MIEQPTLNIKRHEGKASDSSDWLNCIDQDYFEQHHPVRAIAICEVKAKWTGTMDRARGKLLVAAQIGTHHRVNETKCCVSSSLR
jgi:hypothetical protein